MRKDKLLCSLVVRASARQAGNVWFDSHRGSNIFLRLPSSLVVLSYWCLIFRTIKFHSADKRKLVVEEEIIEEDAPAAKIPKAEVVKDVKSRSVPVVKKSIGGPTSSRKMLAGLVKVKKDEPKKEKEAVKPESSSLRLLGAYSDSETSD